MKSDDCLGVAADLGANICARAMWHGRQCAWVIRKDVSTSPTTYTTETSVSRGDLYQGTAGIALVLAELYARTGDQSAFKTAEGAIDHACEQCESLPPNDVGLYSGRIGIALAAARLGKLLDRSDLLRRAGEIVHATDDHGYGRTHLDFVSGSSGAIVGLLALWDILGIERAASLACQIGEHLFDSARRYPWGWALPSRFGYRPDLTGLAHGAAGLGSAFLELFRVTREERFRFAALQAFAYESHYFQAEDCNWPDFRLGFRDDTLAAAHGLSESGVESSSRNRGPRVCLSHWCHGAPGIALTRLRAFELLGLPFFQRDATLALDTTERSISAGMREYCLCHGFAGNCDVLLSAARVWPDGSWRRKVHEHAAAAAEVFGTVSSRRVSAVDERTADSSLMLGAGGVVYFYLRLADEALPSILFPTNGGTGDRFRAGNTDSTVRDRSLNEYLGMTRRALKCLTGRDVASDEMDSFTGESDVLRTWRRVRNYIEAEASAETRQILYDACAPEFERLSMSRARFDMWCEPLVADSPLSVTAMAATRFVLSPWVNLVATRFDWAELSSRETCMNSWSVENAGAGAWYIVFASKDAVRMRRLTHFAWTVLRCFVEPHTLANAVEGVAGSIGGVLPESNTFGSVEQLVFDQMQDAFAAGVIQRYQEV